MGPAQVRPFIGKFFGLLVFFGTAMIIATALIAGFRGAPEPTSGAAPQAAATDEQPTDVHLASLQEAFAISHLGPVRDEMENEAREPARRSALEKPRVAAKATRSPAVISAPLPPPAPASAQQPAAAEQESKPSGLLAFVPKLPSPGDIVDGAASLGDKIASLVRWR